LDEPNSNLDSVSEEALLKALDEVKSKGATIVVITHRPSVLHAADKMLLMRDGQVELFGSRAQVMAQLAPPAARRAMQAGQQAPKLAAQGGQA
jgi:ABC-type protease/lipase transport system fused ATPase/permease subunit